MHKLTIVGESKTQLENTTLREWLRRAGLSVASCWPGDFTAPHEEDVCFVDLSQIGQRPLSGPLMTLGEKSMEVLTGLKLPIHKVRGSLLPCLDGGWVTVAMDPRDLGPQKAQDHLKPTLACDARRAVGCPLPQIPNVTFLASPNKLPEQPPAGAVVSVDIEGAGGQPNIVGVAWEENRAWVFPWGSELREWLTQIFKTNVPTFHNAAFDIPELGLAGVKTPLMWYDTIVMAALVDPSQPMNLQTQVLTHVPGSIAWKGLVNHEKGPDFWGAPVGTYRAMWKNILSRLQRPVPDTGSEWHQFYNGLDTAWGLALYNNLLRRLDSQGRGKYYTDVLMPLQAPLLKMGNDGMPLDTTKLAEYQVKCQLYKHQAQHEITAIGAGLSTQKSQEIETKIAGLLQERDRQHTQGVRKFTQAAELTALRSKLKAVKEFNLDSPAQLAGILYDYFGLPVISTPKGGRCVSEEAILNLSNRVTRGTVKVKGDKDECLKVLNAITAYNHWGHWLDTFLNPPTATQGGATVLLTAYSLHRTQTGRLSSGLDTSDLEKSAKKVRKQQVQNIPKELRDIVKAPDGHTFVGGDYSGIEWAITMWFVSKEYNDGYHTDMLDRFFAGEFDPHNYLAEIAGCSRQVAKIFTHGYNYDGSPRTLARNAGLKDDIGVAVCAAHDKAFKTRKWKDVVIRRAKKEHKIQTPLGWRCYDWSWQPKPSDVLAWLVSGTAADLCKRVMWGIFKDMPQNCRLVTSTHDSFLLQVPEADAEKKAQWLKEHMQRPISWLDGRQWRADVKIGKTWRDVS